MKNMHRWLSDTYPSGIFGIVGKLGVPNNYHHVVLEDGITAFTEGTSRFEVVWQHTLSLHHSNSIFTVGTPVFLFLMPCLAGAYGLVGQLVCMLVLQFLRQH